jgi:hypothetical protein
VLNRVGRDRQECRAESRHPRRRRQCPDRKPAVDRRCRDCLPPGGQGRRGRRRRRRPEARRYRAAAAVPRRSRRLCEGGRRLSSKEKIDQYTKAAGADVGITLGKIIDGQTTLTYRGLLNEHERLTMQRADASIQAGITSATDDLTAMARGGVTSGQAFDAAKRQDRDADPAARQQSAAGLSAGTGAIRPRPPRRHRSRPTGSCITSIRSTRTRTRKRAARAARWSRPRAS